MIIDQCNWRNVFIDESVGVHMHMFGNKRCTGHHESTEFTNGQCINSGTVDAPSTVVVVVMLFKAFFPFHTSVKDSTAVHCLHPESTAPSSSMVLEPGRTGCWRGAGIVAATMMVGV